MNDLVIANIRERPVRTLISVAGVALGVMLVMLFTGLVHGMSNDMQRRASNWQAEIVFTRPGSMMLTSSSANLSTKYVELLQQVAGVRAVVPVIRYITTGQGRFGLVQLDGVDWAPFARMNDMRLVEGRAATAADEVIIDEKQAEDSGVDVGGIIKLFGDKSYRVTGIFAPPSGARIKMSLAAMQTRLEAADKCTYILVKCRNPAEQSAVAERINAALPGNKIHLTSDLIVGVEKRFPIFTPFLHTLVGIAAAVSALFVMLTMYTTITERTREIGILKTLGASRHQIISIIEREALLISVFGLIAGICAATLIGFAVERIYELAFEVSLRWIVWTSLIAVLGSLTGALYPAVRAASIDPVKALGQE